MKHPALARILAVILAILCLVMLLAGLGILRGANSVLEKAEGEAERLRERTEEYRAAAAELEGTEPYKSLKQTLDEMQKEHDERSVRHRINLATYTATRGGVTAGLTALEQAEAAFRAGWQQYLAGEEEFKKQEAAFKEGYQQYLDGKKQLEDALSMVNMARQLIEASRARLQEIRQLGQMIEDGETQRTVLLNACDTAINCFDTATSITDQLKAQNGLSPEQMDMITKLLAEKSEYDLSGAELPAFDAASIAELEAEFTARTGMTPAEFRQTLVEQKQALEDEDSELPLNELEYQSFRLLYLTNRDKIMLYVDLVEEILNEYEPQVREAKKQLDEAKKQLDELAPVMEMGRKGIEEGKKALAEAKRMMDDGAQALYYARAQIWQQRAELRKQEAELKKEKEELDLSAAELAAFKERADEQQKKEQRETGLRILLMDRDDVYERVEQGEELIAAAEHAAEKLLEDAREQYSGRTRAAQWMLLGAALGLLSLPAAFEKLRSLFWLLPPLLGCIGCALWAVQILYLLGRGYSYSALSAAGAAFLTMLAALPRKRKKKTAE